MNIQVATGRTAKITLTTMLAHARLHVRFRVTVLERVISQVGQIVRLGTVFSIPFTDYASVYKADRE